MKMTPKLFSPHWNHVAHVSVMLMIKIQLALLVGVIANQFCSWQRYNASVMHLGGATWAAEEDLAAGSGIEESRWHGGSRYGGWRRWTPADDMEQAATEADQGECLTAVSCGGNGDDQREGDGGTLVTTKGTATMAWRQILVVWRSSLQNPPGSRFSRRGIVCYIGGMSLVSVVLKWPTPKISIFGVDCLYTADTYDY
jgi:hypothetical protein